MRLHLDVRVDDLDAAVDAVVRRRRHRPAALDQYDEGTVVVMGGDPEGNEFCLVALGTGRGACLTPCRVDGRVIRSSSGRIVSGSRVSGKAPHSNIAPTESE